MENEELKKLVDAVGASAEIVGILRKALMAAGFNEQDSLYLCGEVLKTLFVSANKKKG